jgi:tRNA (guanine37-N1)-methyltransferase
MRFDVVTIFPELIEAFSGVSLIGRARSKGVLEIVSHDPREFTEDRHNSVDDEPYGGGGGMVMTALPLLSAIRTVDPEHRAIRILMSPQGERLDEALVSELALEETLVLVCGRYEGVDERVRQLVIDREVSIGDYVLSGGELAAMVLIEAVSRKIEGVVGLAASVENDSFRDGLLDHPHYTRPAEVEGRSVPAELLSGNHAEIERWRRGKAIEATLDKRPDMIDKLLEEGRLTPQERLLVERLLKSNRARSSSDLRREPKKRDN